MVAPSARSRGGREAWWNPWADAEPEQTLDELNDTMVNALSASAAAYLPQTRQARKRPWVTDATLELIAARNRARAQCHLEREKILNGSSAKGAREARQNICHDGRLQRAATKI